MGFNPEWQDKTKENKNWTVWDFFPKLVDCDVSKTVGLCQRFETGTEVYVPTGQ